MLDMIGKAFWQVIMEYVLKAAIMVSLAIWACALSLTFCFTSNYFITDFEKSNFLTKTSINIVRSFRHNCRIVWGTILPIDPITYPGITTMEIKMLPKPAKALYQFDSFWGRTQKQGLHLISLNALELERTTLAIFMTSKEIYANSLLSEIKLQHKLDRSPAQE